MIRTRIRDEKLDVWIDENICTKITIQLSYHEKKALLFYWYLWYFVLLYSVGLMVPLIGFVYILSDVKETKWYFNSLCYLNPTPTPQLIAGAVNDKECSAEKNGHSKLVKCRKIPIPCNKTVLFIWERSNWWDRLELISKNHWFPFSIQYRYLS